MLKMRDRLQIVGGSACASRAVKSAADGAARVFNALARLAEDSAGFSTGESPLELETRADSILESVTTVQTVQTAAKDNEEFAPPGVEIAHLEILDFEDVEDTDRSVEDTDRSVEDTDRSVEDADRSVEDADRSMEFTLPPGELDRIFVESKKTHTAADSAAGTTATAGTTARAKRRHNNRHNRAPRSPSNSRHNRRCGARHPPPAHPGARTEPAPDAEPDAELPLHPESAASRCRGRA